MHTFTESEKEIAVTLEISFITPYEANIWNVRKIRHCFLYSCNDIANFCVLIGTIRRLKFVTSIFSFVTLFFFKQHIQWDWEDREETNENSHLAAMLDKESKEKSNYFKSVRGHLTLKEACHLVPKENRMSSFYCFIVSLISQAIPVLYKLQNYTYILFCSKIRRNVKILIFYWW